MLLAAACLTLMGLVTLFSASQSIYNNEFTILKKQLVWLVIALAAGVGTFVTSVERMRNWAWIFSANPHREFTESEAVHSGGKNGMWGRLTTITGPTTIGATITCSIARPRKTTISPA